MSIGIYKITNMINGKSYIGQSIHIERRWKEHCFKTNKSCISKAIQKYKKENFSFEILEECKIDELNQKEQYYIKKFNSIVPNGYNIDEINLETGIHNIFSTYNKKIFLEIVSDIRNSNLSFSEIGEKYNISVRMVYYINSGQYHTQEDIEYPLRKVINYNPKYCIDCGKKISSKAIRCVKCQHKLQYKCEHPTREQLKKEIRENSFVSLGKKYGVSDNAIRKWCKSYNLPFNTYEIKKYSDLEWEKI